MVSERAHNIDIEIRMTHAKIHANTLELQYHDLLMLYFEIHFAWTCTKICVMQ